MKSQCTSLSVRMRYKSESVSASESLAAKGGAYLLRVGVCVILMVTGFLAWGAHSDPFKVLPVSPYIGDTEAGIKRLLDENGAKVTIPHLGQHWTGRMKGLDLMIVTGRGRVVTGRRAELTGMNMKLTTIKRCNRIYGIWDRFLLAK